MGLGLVLRATRPKPGLLSRRRSAEDWLRGVERWFDDACGPVLFSSAQAHDELGRPRLVVALHPVSEHLRITHLDGLRIEVEAGTSPTGPGYHDYVCRLLDRLAADHRLSWETADEDESTGDETGYFTARDRQALEDRMLTWLGGLARQILWRIEEGGGADWAINYGFDEPAYQHDGLVWTPLGPRDHRWLMEVARDPASGTDLFPWWEPGLGAGYCLGRALGLMWTRVRWRPPITDEERTHDAQVLDLLELAHAEAPDLAYPRAEWAELAGYAGRAGPPPADPASRAAGRSGLAPAGYRRRPLRVRLPGGWSVEVPGSLAELTSPDGSWQGFDDRRAVFVSSLLAEARDRDQPPSGTELIESLSSLTGPGVIEHAGEGLVGRARFQTDDDGNLHLMAATAVSGRLASCTISIGEEDRDWALHVWRSIRHAPPDE